MLKDPIRQRLALEQGHRLVPASLHMCENVHAADEREAAVDRDDLLVFLPEIDRACDLRCELLVTRLPVPGHLRCVAGPPRGPGRRGPGHPEDAGATL
jgi:hypothetical protein